MFYHGERMNSIDFGCYRSKVKVTMTMCIIDKCGVRGDATLCVVIFYILVWLNEFYTIRVLYVLKETDTLIVIGL